LKPLGQHTERKHKQKKNTLQNRLLRLQKWNICLVSRTPLMLVQIVLSVYLHIS